MIELALPWLTHLKLKITKSNNEADKLEVSGEVDRKGQRSGTEWKAKTRADDLNSLDSTAWRKVLNLGEAHIR